MVIYFGYNFIVFEGDEYMSNLVKSTITLLLMLTYAWFMVLLSLFIVERIIMKYIWESWLRTVLGFITYILFLIAWYFSVKMVVNRKIKR